MKIGPIHYSPGVARNPRWTGFTQWDTHCGVPFPAKTDRLSGWDAAQSREVGRPGDEILPGEHTHVSTKGMKADGDSPSSRVEWRIGVGWRLAHWQSVADCLLKDGSQDPDQRPIRPPQQNMCGAVRQYHTDDPVYWVAHSNIPHCTGDIPVQVVCLPGLHKFPLPGSRGPASRKAQTHTQKKNF